MGKITVSYKENGEFVQKEVEVVFRPHLWTGGALDLYPVWPAALAPRVAGYVIADEYFTGAITYWPGGASGRDTRHRVFADLPCKGKDGKTTTIAEYYASRAQWAFVGAKDGGWEFASLHGNKREIYRATRSDHRRMGEDFARFGGEVKQIHPAYIMGNLRFPTSTHDL